MDVTFDYTIGGNSTTSYVSVDYFKQFCFDNGYTDIADVPDSDIKRYLNKASFWIDNNFRQHFSGIREYDDQTMEWPRSSSYYPLGNFYIDEDSIPSEISKASSEAAYLLLTGEDISPIISKSGKVKSSREKVDVIETEYTYGDGSTLYKDIYTIVNETLSRLIGSVSSRSVLKLIRVGGESP